MYICVDPSAYSAASQIFGEYLADEVKRINTALQTALADSARMAGHDPAGAQWAVDYDRAAGEAAQIIADLHGATLTVGALLQASGFNHARAEGYSDLTGGELPPETLSYSAGFATPCIYVPSAAGGGIPDPPKGWELVATVGGLMWPDGDPDKLRRISTAWSDAANGLEQCWPLVSQGIAALDAQESPEIEQARGVCRSIGEAATQIAEQCRAISAAAADQASHIEQARDEIRGEIAAFLALTVAIEATAIAAGVFTAGIGTAGMQVVEGAEAANAATRITLVLARFLEAASITGRAMSAKTLDGVGDGLKIILKRTPTIAEATPVAGALKAMDLLASKLADSPWLYPPSPRGFAIETRLGGNLPPSFPTIDKWDFVTGTATSIKSVDLTAASYQSASRLTSLMQKYIDKAAKFDGANWGGVRIEPVEIITRQLEVSIPRGATAAQETVLSEMAEYARSRGVKLIVGVTR